MTWSWAVESLSAKWSAWSHDTSSCACYCRSWGDGAVPVTIDDPEAVAPVLSSCRAGCNPAPSLPQPRFPRHAPASPLATLPYPILRRVSSPRRRASYLSRAPAPQYVALSQPGMAHLASTGLDTAGAERGHQVRKDLGILAAAKDQLGEQQPIIGDDVHSVIGKNVDLGHVQERKTLLREGPGHDAGDLLAVAIAQKLLGDVDGYNLRREGAEQRLLELLGGLWHAEGVDKAGVWSVRRRTGAAREARTEEPKAEEDCQACPPSAPTVLLVLPTASAAWSGTVPHLSVSS